MPLETVDLRDVELLKADVVIHGRGSPPSGDVWSSADLRAMADAARELGDEWRAPAKVGHGGGDQPAVGWLDRVRVSADGKRLLGDILSVPAKFAELVRSRAYRSRSLELSRVKSQRSGKEYPWVPTAVAWLGAALPAVKGLADVAALYSDEGVELQRAYAFEAPTERSNVMTTELIDAAVDDGRIAAENRVVWEETFAVIPEGAARILESQPLDLHQRMSNRHALTTFAPQETEEEARVYQAEFEALHGGDSTRETNDDDGYSYSTDAAARGIEVFV
jgi:hypothetical protein